MHELSLNKTEWDVKFWLLLICDPCSLPSVMLIFARALPRELLGWERFWTKGDVMDPSIVMFKEILDASYILPAETIWRCLWIPFCYKWEWRRAKRDKVHRKWLLNRCKRATPTAGCPAWLYAAKIFGRYLTWKYILNKNVKWKEPGKKIQSWNSFSEGRKFRLEKTSEDHLTQPLLNNSTTKLLLTKESSCNREASGKHIAILKDFVLIG